jgi:alpha-methylacyl-CoA racemase
MKLLEGIRVLDTSRLIPGPLLSMLLADLGADVIKVEDTGTGDYLRTSRNAADHGGVFPTFEWLNRNKRGITIDVRSDDGRELLLQLAEQCDVFVEGARAGAAAKRGLGYEDVSARNNSIVYCSITGFGQSGPFASLATHGGAYDAVSGLATPHELPDGSYVQHRPFPHGLTYGSWLGAMAVCAALVRARRGGPGSYLDISCADATLMALSQEAMPVLNDGRAWPADPAANVAVKYSYYKTKDDRFMLLQSIEQHFWQAFCDAVERPDLRDSGDWTTSHMDLRAAEHGDPLRRELVDIFRTRTQAEWTDLFIEKNIAGAPYYPLTEAPTTDLFNAREMFITQEHPENPARTITTIANAIKVDGEPFNLRRGAPDQGQHTTEVLAELGYSDAAIADLRDRGVI